MRLLPFLKLNNKPRRESARQLLLSDDIIYIILPCLHQNEIIKFAGVCSSWRRIVIDASEGSFSNVLYHRSEFKKIPMKIENKSENQQVLLMFSKFDFSDCNLTLSQFKRIFMSTKLTSLTLCRTNIMIFPSESLTFLTINQINLSLNNIEQLILQLKNLKNLSLLHTDVDCECIDLIINNNQLESLIIEQKIISERGFSAVFNPHFNSSLNTLHVKSLNTEEFLSFNIDTLKFAHLRTLEIIGLFDRLVLEKIFNYGLELTYLAILTTSIMSYDVDFSYVHQIPSLKSFSYNGPLNNVDVQQFLNKDMEHILFSDLDTVSSLNLSRILCDKYTSLISLELSNCELPTNCGQYIYNLKHLTKLDMGYSKIQSTICGYIFKMKTLVHLNLKCCKLRDDGLKYLEHHNLDNIQTLILEENEFTYIGFEYLIRAKFHRPLKYLSIFDHINNKGTIHFDTDHTLNVKTLFICDRYIDYRGVISILQNCIIEELIIKKPQLLYLGSHTIKQLSKKNHVKVVMFI